MVLHHVAQLSDLVVIGPSTLNAYHFPYRDLNVINAGVVPLAIDEAVCETQNQQILDRFFTQIVVDSVDRLFIKVS